MNTTNFDMIVLMLITTLFIYPSCSFDHKKDDGKDEILVESNQSISKEDTFSSINVDEFQPEKIEASSQASEEDSQLEISKTFDFSTTESDKTLSKNSIDQSEVSKDSELPTDHSQVVESEQISQKEEIETVLVDTNSAVEELEPTKEGEESKSDGFVAQIDHSLFNEMSQRHISNTGDVNYTAWKKEEKNLDNYLSLLSANHPTSSWQGDEALAYWINAYNAFTIKLILKSFPVKSITDLDGGDPWKVKWIKIGNKTYSLNNIEHDIIRPTFKEPRIHFAVNCAASSCPPLKPKAYTASNLESLLEESTRYFVNNQKYNKISSENAQVSKIFEWYAEDFGDLKSFLNAYSKTKLNKNASISYSEYDWSLNGK